MKDLVAIIPVSSFNESKTRLSPFLNEKERIQLLKYMLKDIITTIENEVDEFEDPEDDEFPDDEIIMEFEDSIIGDMMEGDE